LRSIHGIFTERGNADPLKVSGKLAACLFSKRVDSESIQPAKKSNVINKLRELAAGYFSSLEALSAA
jgi:hypothetical protein